MVGTTLRYELTRVTIVLVPSLLRRAESTRIGIALGFEVKDGVDRAARAAVANSDHDRVLVRTHNIGDAVQHINQSPL